MEHTSSPRRLYYLVSFLCGVIATMAICWGIREYQSRPVANIAPITTAVLPEKKPFQKGAKKTICLTMIVKNESKIVERCLNSIKDKIDYWVIIDTGSTDGTQEVIRKCMKGMPGELHERPWVDFAHNRNEALMLSKPKADYSLFIDADEMLVLADDFQPLELNKDCYLWRVKQIAGGGDYYRIALVNNHQNWQWKGVLHELIECPEARTYELLAGMVNESDTTKGARSADPEKYLKDAMVLEKAIEKEPNNSRYRFYLAQCYLNAQNYAKAMENYEKRAEMPDHNQETFFSIFMAARLEEVLNMPPEKFSETYKKAYNSWPSRMEPLFYLGSYYLRKQDYQAAYDTFKAALATIPSRADMLFVEYWIYDWGCLFNYAQCCYHLKKYDETRTAFAKILEVKELPPQVRQEVTNNLMILQQTSSYR